VVAPTQSERLVAPARLAVPAAVPALLARVGVLRLLALVTAVAAGARVAAAWLHATPVYLPDEYMYSELGRSLSESGRPLVRGVAAQFPALLEPALTAPFWLIDDVHLAFRLVQAFGAVAMSLAAPAAYALARRSGARPAYALGVAVLAVTVPDTLYAGWLIAEPFTYPLVVGALAAGVAALSRPSARAQLLFVSLSALAVLGRAQFVVVPACFVVAAFLLGLRERNLRRVLREQRLPLLLFAVPLVGLLLTGRSALGIYGAPGSEVVWPWTLAARAGDDSLVLLYAAGWVIVPGALLGIYLALRDPRSRGELAFALLGVVTTLALLFEAATFGDVQMAQERYVFYAVPLLAVGFALYAARGWPLRKAHALLVGGMLLLSVRFPLSEFSAVGGLRHSPVLQALTRLEISVGSVGTAALVFAIAAGALCAVLLVLPRLGGGRASVAAFALAALSSTALCAGAISFDARNAQDVVGKYFPSDLSWVDAQGLGDVALVRSRDSRRIDSIQMFWNRDVDRVLMLPGAERLDAFTNEQLGIRPDGTLFSGDETITSALLVDDYSVTALFTGATPVAHATFHTLWKPHGTPRLSLYAIGRYYDGWLAGSGGIALWPKPGARSLAGFFTMRVTGNAALGDVDLVFDLPNGRKATYSVAPGQTKLLRVPVCSQGSWQVPFHTTKRQIAGGRGVSLTSGVPGFTPDARGCAGNAI
jgi:hypothetical protein